MIGIQVSRSVVFILLVCVKCGRLELKTISVNPGQTFQLDCPINDTNSTTWTGPPNNNIYAVGPEILEQQMETMIAINGSSLIILNVSKIDDIIKESFGIFMCSKGFEEKHQFNVTLRNPPSLEIKSMINGTIIRCIPKNFQTRYTFSQWEHKTEFGDQIRFLNGTISIDNEYSELHVPSDSGTYALQERGVYICRVKNDVDGPIKLSKEYFLQLEGKPYFVASNDLVQNGKLGHENHVQVKFVSFPNITSHSLSINGKIITSSTRYTMNEDNFTDTMYGQTVLIRGYLLQYSFIVTSKELFNECSVTVMNPFGETKFNFRLHFLKSQIESSSSKSDVYGVFVIPVLVGCAVMAYFFFIKGWRPNIKGVCCFLKDEQNEDINIEPAVAIENDMYNLQNNAPPTRPRDDVQVYSSIERRQRIALSDQAVSYSLSAKRKPGQSTSSRAVKAKKRKEQTKDGISKSENTTTELNYVDIEFESQGDKRRSRIRGDTAKTEYVDIDFTKKFNGVPPISDDSADSDEDFTDVKELRQMRRKTACEPTFKH